MEISYSGGPRDGLPCSPCREGPVFPAAGAVAAFSSQAPWIWPQMQSPLGLPRRLRGNESTCKAGAAADRFDPWVGKVPKRREWLPTPVFLPGEFHGQKSLVGYSPWVCKESTHRWSNLACTQRPLTQGQVLPRVHIPGLSGDGKEGSLGPEGQLWWVISSPELPTGLVVAAGPAQRLDSSSAQAHYPLLHPGRCNSQALLNKHRHLSVKSHSQRNQTVTSISLWDKAKIKLALLNVKWTTFGIDKIQGTQAPNGSLIILEKLRLVVRRKNPRPGWIFIKRNLMTKCEPLNTLPFPFSQASLQNINWCSTIIW